MNNSKEEIKSYLKIAFGQLMYGVTSIIVFIFLILPRNEYRMGGAYDDHLRDSELIYDDLTVMKSFFALFFSSLFILINTLMIKSKKSSKAKRVFSASSCAIFA